MDCSFAWAQIGYMHNLAYATDPYNEWLLVMDDSAEEFASIPYYQAAVKAGLDPEHVTPEGYAIVTGKNVALREGPSTGCKVLIRVPTGTKIKLTDPPSDWDHVSYSGKDGYMMSKYLQKG